MVNLFKKSKTWEKPFSEKVAKRVSRIPTAELAMWTDQAIFELGRCLSSFEKTREPYYLTEALTGAEALHAVVDEYTKRFTTTK